MNPQGDTKYTTSDPRVTSRERYNVTAQRLPGITSSSQRTATGMCLPRQHGHGTACVCMCYSSGYKQQYRPTTADDHHQPPPTITDPHPSYPPRTFLVHRPRPALGSVGNQPKALPSLRQSCAKSQPRSAGGLAQCGVEGGLSLSLIGCGGRLMCLGGCRLQQQPAAATDYCCLSLAVSPTHTTARCAPCMCPPNKVLWLTMYPMCKSTSNLLLIRRHGYVGCRCPFCLFSFFSFDASMPRFHAGLPLRRCLIPSYHLIYRRALVYLPETMIILPCSLPLPCPRYPTPLQNHRPRLAANCR